MWILQVQEMKREIEHWRFDSDLMYLSPLAVVAAESSGQLTMLLQRLSLRAGLPPSPRTQRTTIFPRLAKALTQGKWEGQTYTYIHIPAHII